MQLSQILRDIILGAESDITDVDNLSNGLVLFI